MESLRAPPPPSKAKVGGREKSAPRPAKKGEGGVIDPALVNTRMIYAGEGAGKPPAGKSRSGFSGAEGASLTGGGGSGGGCTALMGGF